MTSEANFILFLNPFFVFISFLFALPFKQSEDREVFISL